MAGEMISRRAAALAAALLVLALPATAAGTTDRCPGGAHGERGYGYAGHQSALAASGIRATITPLRAPAVRDGHVAGWIGVGGPGAGPGGASQWLQAGIAALPGAGLLVYTELMRPGGKPRFRLVELDAAPGAARVLAVEELPGRTDWWQATLDGRPVTKPVHLPGFHGRIRPIATAESWNGGTPVCNAFAFRFDDVSVSTKPGGAWSPFIPGARFRDDGFALRPSASRTLAAGAPASYSFVASTG
jgi:hypothetical protein